MPNKNQPNTQKTWIVARPGTRCLPCWQSIQKNPSPEHRREQFVQIGKTKRMAAQEWLPIAAERTISPTFTCNSRGLAKRKTRGQALSPVPYKVRRSRGCRSTIRGGTASHPGDGTSSPRNLQSKWVEWGED